jgi:hypothetical protein
MTGQLGDSNRERFMGISTLMWQLAHDGIKKPSLTVNYELAYVNMA